MAYYTATVGKDGRFESAYVLIGRTKDGELYVIVKKGQPVWGERTGEYSAVVLDGSSYLMSNGVWYEVSEV